MSGKGVLPIALKCVKEIREAVSVPIIGCGGISNAEDVRAFSAEGASIFGVGSALTGLSSEAVTGYFESLQEDLKNNTNHSAAKIRYDVDMDFTPYKIVSNEKVADDISIVTFDGKINVSAGEFIYTWLPGYGEKPFSALTAAIPGSCSRSSTTSCAISPAR